MGGEALEVPQGLDEGKIHAGKRQCYRGRVFNKIYEKPMVFLASRQKEELKKLYPTGFILHLTRKVLATKPEKRK